METEVKLAFKDKDSLFKAALSEDFRKFLGDSEPDTMLLENSYLDTNDMKILKRNASVRQRHVKGSEDYYEETVKFRGGASGGLHRRFEWNVRHEGKFSVDDFKSLAKEHGDPVELLDIVFEGVENDDLTVLCFNSFQRTVYELEFKDSKIEACFDSGLIKNSDGSKTDEICELELELITGDEDDLKELSGLISSKFDCHPLDKSKFQRTLELARRG